ncbi:PREDICTED: uncharacterized protein LOC109230067 [Nicotiana attenuata]|uniref:uncharacterized protein LOC109230067 n=1 Tax=Nicotiana attenuata TaxID=49451 RepID=UPI000905C98C|nr:PREDICTED: uncharacterized protein LOC109230067 [Nicotiana attenuata]
MVKALRLGPWFISGNFLSIRKWEPKFVPQEATLSTTAIWIRLPQLPMEFYDKEILQKVGRKLGKLLKIDSCTSSTLRGRYARICIQVPLETPIETSVIIGDHKQAVIYKVEGTLCTSCGRTSKGCNYRKPQPTVPSEAPKTSEKNVEQREENEWKTVTFPKRKKQGQQKSNDRNGAAANNQHHSTHAQQIQVNMFDGNSGNLTYDPMIYECMLLMQRMDRVVVRHTYKEHNRVADPMAKEAAKPTFLGRSSLLAVPSMFANDIFWADILGTGVVRNFLACNIETVSQNIALLGELQYPSNDSTLNVLFV